METTEEFQTTTTTTTTTVTIATKATTLNEIIDCELCLDFNYKIERQYIKFNCSVSAGFIVEFIEIRKSSGKLLKSIENSSSLQIKLRKWQFFDNETIICTAQDGPVTNETTLSLIF